MIKWLRRKILGGTSDKREGAWLIFLIVNAILIYAVRKEAMGVELPQTWAFLTIAWPGTMAAVIGVHAQHFHAQAKAGRAERDLDVMDEYRDHSDSDEFRAG